MNDTELEAWLAARFRAAPSPEPPGGLQQAVRSDRIRASIPPEATGRSRLWGLARPRRAFGGMVALAFTAVLAVGLLTVVVLRPTQSTVSSGSEIAWRPAVQVPGTSFMFGPYLATAGGKLFMVGSTAPAGGTQTTEVWSSPDGTNWEPVSAPGAFEKSGRFFPQGISSDGQGGLIVVGGVSSDQTETTIPTAWHSTDGRTWTQAQVGTAALARMAGVAARPGAIVAIGDWRVPVSGGAADQTVNQMYAWFSADGNNWSQVVLPDSSGYAPMAVTAWKGGFAAIAQSDGLVLSSSIWTSADGRTWEKTTQDFVGFGPLAITALGGRVVAVGDYLDPKGSVGSLVPTSWSSTDGRTWVKATASARQAATGFGDVTVVGDSLVAIGANYTGQGVVTFGLGGPTAAPVPAPAANVWISSDGLTWRLLADDPKLILGFYLNTHVAGLGDRVVLATSGEVFVGDLTP
ncbi:MAG TPA: sialidase family protein [Candidatus Limnocylindrales bacterium]